MFHCCVKILQVVSVAEMLSKQTHFLCEKLRDYDNIPALKYVLLIKIYCIVHRYCACR